MGARAEVELDVFSGMPNPTWALTDAEADRFDAQLNELPRSPRTSLSGNLGYRGFIVHVVRGTQRRVVRIQTGIVQIAGGATDVYARDEGRRLERWLLATGKPHLTDELLRLPDLR